MGLEPTTFSLQGNCAPNCATAPCQTAVLQSGRSDTSMCYIFPFEVTAHRELLCRTLHSYSTAGCEFSLTRYPQRLSSLLYGRAIWPRKPRWSSHGDSNSDFHLERVASQPVRGWDDKDDFSVSRSVGLPVSGLKSVQSFGLAQIFYAMAMPRGIEPRSPERQSGIMTAILWHHLYFIRLDEIDQIEQRLTIPLRNQRHPNKKLKPAIPPDTMYEVQVRSTTRRFLFSFNLMYIL